MAQLVEHILGKDEVPSSNLGSSSRQPRSSLSLGALVFILISVPSLTYRRGCRELLPVLRAWFSDEAENRFAYPARSSKSSLLRRRARVSSPWRISVQTTPKLIEPRGFFILLFFINRTRALILFHEGFYLASCVAYHLLAVPYNAYCTYRCKRTHCQYKTRAMSFSFCSSKKHNFSPFFVIFISLHSP